MIAKIKLTLMSLVISFGLAVPAVVAVPTLGGVAHADIKKSLCTGASAAESGGANCGTAGTGTGDEAASSLKQLGTKIINIFSVVIGVIAVIMIIYGGFRYITSGGDSGRVGNAKNTLIYAIVGLIIVALAQIIVHFVLNVSTSAVPPTA